MDSGTGRDTVDANDPTLGLILRMLDNIQATMENGLAAVNQRLDTLNGRTTTNQQNIATLDERTSRMVCVTHAGLLGQLETDVKALKDAPVKSQAKTAAITGTTVAALVVIVEGVAQWLMRARP